MSKTPGMFDHPLTDKPFYLVNDCDPDPGKWFFTGGFGTHYDAALANGCAGKDSGYRILGFDDFMRWFETHMELGKK